MSETHATLLLTLQNVNATMNDTVRFVSMGKTAPSDKTVQTYFVRDEGNWHISDCNAYVYLGRQSLQCHTFGLSTSALNPIPEWPREKDYRQFTFKTLSTLICSAGLEVESFNLDKMLIQTSLAELSSNTSICTARHSD